MALIRNQFPYNILLMQKGKTWMLKRTKKIQNILIIKIK